MSEVRKVTFFNYPALFAEHGERMLVDGIDVRPLLAVNLDVDEQPVHQLRHRRRLEAFMRHHMAPMAGRVADG